jgi:opacity protein-like surface antigen
MVALRFKKSVVAVIVSFAAAGVAHSADLAIPPLAPVQDFSGWYLRGDIGFSNQQVGSLFNQNYSRFDSVTNIDKGFDAAPLFVLGVGYNVNNWLRFDVTGEYRARANFHGLDIGFTALPGPAGNNFWPDRYTASKFEWTFLFNGYVDLGTWWNFTPFVGAGVGFTRNTITNFGDINVTTGIGADAHSSDASKWNFAWALYAGIGYRVTDALTLELAYRYINLGDATTGTMVGFTGNFDTPFEFRHLTSQDVKLGLRFNFGAYDYLPPPPPLRTKG